MNPRANKDKGRRHEVEIREYLKAAFPDLAEDIERNGTTYGVNDKGDIRGFRDWVIEAKNEKEIRLSAYMQEVERERENAGVPYGVAVVKARGKGVAQSYAVMPFHLFVEVLKRLG